MEILKPDNKTMQFLGVFMPQKDFVFLTVYVLAKGLNRSQLVRQIITEWINSQHPTKNLLDEIISRIEAQWEKQPAQDAPARHIFNQNIRTELTNKGLGTEEVEYIMNAL